MKIKKRRVKSKKIVVKFFDSIKKRIVELNNFPRIIIGKLFYIGPLGFKSLYQNVNH